MLAKAPLSDRLLAWYDAHRRDLPWRARPGETPDPYRVWLSEVMLQQTTVATVSTRFEAFIERWPTVEALAAAPAEAVMSAWAGLGYYARARNLHACAKVVATQFGGRFPDSEAALRALPGLGDYSAAAVAAIAFGRRSVVVDANVARVMARLFALAKGAPAGLPRIRAAMDQVTPESRAGDFAQAMMDLGATICTPRAPRCLLCPIAADCLARTEGDPEAYPVKPIKRARPERFGTAFWAERDGEVLLVTRPAKGLLGGMRALPTGDWTEAVPGLAGAPVAADWRLLPGAGVAHGFTHFTLTLALARSTVERQEEPPGAIWWPIDRLDAAGLPTVFAKAARAFQELR